MIKSSLLVTKMNIAVEDKRYRCTVLVIYEITVSCVRDIWPEMTKGLITHTPLHLVSVDHGIDQCGSVSDIFHEYCTP